MSREYELTMPGDPDHSKMIEEARVSIGLLTDAAKEAKARGIVDEDFIGAMILVLAQWCATRSERHEAFADLKCAFEFYFRQEMARVKKSQL